MEAICPRLLPQDQACCLDHPLQTRGPGLSFWVLCVHEGSHDPSGGPAQRVGRQQRVVAVVDVGGLVEAQAAVASLTALDIL